MASITSFTVLIILAVLFSSAFAQAGYYLGPDLNLLPCPAGSYCPGDGSKHTCANNEVAPPQQASCTPCDNSTVQNSEQSACISCSSTQYITRIPAVYECAACEAGQQCNGVTQSPCPIGNFCQGGVPTPCGDYEVASGGAQACTACVSPEFPRDDRSACTTCLAGWYGTATGCANCNVGHSCNGVDQTPCESGKVAPAGQFSCTPCSMGSGLFPDSNRETCVECEKLNSGSIEYGDGDGCHLCPAGFECNGISKNLCSGNFISDTGAFSCSPCPSHTYSNPEHTACNQCEENEFDNGSQCEACPAGYSCDRVNKTPCGANLWSPGGQKDCEECPANSYPNDDKTSCVACTSPTEYNDVDNKKCSPCPAGYICNGTENKTQCSPGEISPEGVGSCSSCGVGQFTDNTQGACVTCELNEYGHPTTKKCTICPAGHSCDRVDATQCTGNTSAAEGDGVCDNCPAHSYTNDDFSQCIACLDPTEYDNTTDGRCDPCPKGKQCDGTNNLTNCNTGYVSDLGIGICTPCNNGYYANADQSQCSACPAGRGTPDTGAYGSEDDCETCQAGYASNGSGPCVKCPSGLTDVKKQNCRDVCPDGQYLGADGCTQCDEGHYCTLDIIRPCEGNTYAPVGQGSCTPCENGFVNDDRTGCETNLCPGQPGTYFVPAEVPPGTDASAVPSSIQGKCVPCPRGSICINGRLHTMGLGRYETVNKASTKLNIGSESELQDCGDGYAVDGKTACRSCIEEGEYFDLETAQCLKCPPGFACPANENDPIECYKTGQFQPLAGKTSCLDCNTFVSFDGVQCITCLPGQYPNRITRTCMPCPIGHKCNGSSQPVLCGIHEYQPATGRSGCRSCPEPSTVNEERSDCTLCESGEYYHIGLEQCITCPPGYRCTNNHAYRCGENEYAPAGQGSCSACESHKPGVPGFISADRDRCIVCKVGSYVNRHTENCDICPKGWRCPDGVNRYRCFGGFETHEERSYQDLPGRIDCADEKCLDPSYVALNGTVCLECPPGKYVSDRSICEPCPAGYYCKNSQRIPCPPRTYSVSGNSDRCYSCDNGRTDENQAICTPCPEGEYMSVDVEGDAKCLTCNEGFYCTNGYRHRCAAMTWSGPGESACRQCPGGVISEARISCSICEPGMYPDENQQVCLACEPGFSCQGGTKYECLDGWYAPKGSTKCFRCSAGYVSYDRSSCLSGFSAYTDRASGALGDGNFIAVGVVWGLLLLIGIIIHSCFFGCMCWPKKLIDPEWGEKETEMKKKLDEAEKKRREASEAAEKAFKKTKSGRDADIRRSLAAGEVTGNTDSLEKLVTESSGSMTAKTRGQAMNMIQKRGGMRGMVRARGRGMRGVPSSRARRVTSLR